MFNRIIQLKEVQYHQVMVFMKGNNYESNII